MSRRRNSNKNITFQLNPRTPVQSFRSRDVQSARAAPVIYRYEQRPSDYGEARLTTVGLTADLRRRKPPPSNRRLNVDLRYSAMVFDSKGAPSPFVTERRVLEDFGQTTSRPRNNVLR
jgi:hypothetical protein